MATKILTHPGDNQTLTAAELDELAQTSVAETLEDDIIARALTSPPFIALGSRKSASSEDGKVNAPVACLNFRDAATSERTPELRKRKVFRAGKSAFDAGSLFKLGIVRVYDLRSAKELERDPHIGFEDDNAVQVIWREPSSSLGEHFEKNQGNGNDILVESYMSILKSHTDAFRGILTDLASKIKPDQAILLHCTAGKDRTGVAAAMLLSLAGCSNKGIASDYALTRIGIEPARNHLIKAMQATIPGFAIDDPRFRALSESLGEDMLKFLQRVQSEYGGFEQYAEKILGVTSEQLQMVKQNLRA